MLPQAVPVISIDQLVFSWKTYPLFSHPLTLLPFVEKNLRYLLFYSPTHSLIHSSIYLVNIYYMPDHVQGAKDSHVLSDIVSTVFEFLV